MLLQTQAENKGIVLVRKTEYAITSQSFKKKKWRKIMLVEWYQRHRVVIQDLKESFPDLRYTISKTKISYKCCLDFRNKITDYYSNKKKKKESKLWLDVKTVS